MEKNDNNIPIGEIREFFITKNKASKHVQCLDLIKRKDIPSHKIMFAKKKEENKARVNHKQKPDYEKL